ncbi:MAG: hypothetical protein GF350_05150 [Chitinivibrionales bacterium]|nr:hypothetical protein [Chitinivibrionales bacterium]
MKSIICDEVMSMSNRRMFRGESGERASKDWSRNLGAPHRHGFRPECSAHDALDEIKWNLKEGRTSIYDADLKSYFDTIPHVKLMACIRRRIVDRSVLRLIRIWLESPIEDRNESGRKHVDRPDKGTPQGGVISPLLANLYLHCFDKVFNGMCGPRMWANVRIVRYADDFVIMARYVGRRITDFTESTLERRFGLR